MAVLIKKNKKKQSVKHYSLANRKKNMLKSSTKLGQEFSTLRHLFQLLQALKKTESRKRGSDIALDLISHSLYPASSYLHEWTFVSLETPQALQAAGTCPLLCIPNCTFSHNKNVQENSSWQPLTQRIILPVLEPNPSYHFYCSPTLSQHSLFQEIKKYLKA